MKVGAWAGTVWRRARSASTLRLPAPFAARTRKPPAMATFFQKMTACAGSPKSAWNSAAEAIENAAIARSEEHTSELQSLMRISYAVFCLKKQKTQSTTIYQHILTP